MGAGGTDASANAARGPVRGVPSASLIARARYAARVAELARWAWIAFGAVALPFLLLPVARAGRRWIASGAPQGVVRRTLSSAAHWQAQYAAPAFWLASCAAILRIAGTRMPALNPQTLWADDVTVACLAKLDSFWTAVTVSAPLAPGFVALLWVARRMIGDPEVSLQVLPLAFGLVGPVLTGIVGPASPRAASGLHRGRSRPRHGEPRA